MDNHLLNSRNTMSILLCSLLMLGLNAAISGELTGRVVGVADGDTVTVLSPTREQIKVRLAGIDAPELRQPYGSQSKSSLSQLLFAQTVTVQWSKHDQYGRVIGRILAGGRDASLEQIRTGMAWHYKRYASEQPPILRSAYANAELYARRQRIGLWSPINPQPPWELRKEKRRAAATH